METEKRVKEIERRIMLVNIIDSPGVIMVGLGLYGKFGVNGDPFHPLLGNELLLNGMLGIGVLIMGWGGFMVLKLAREKARLLREAGL